MKFITSKHETVVRNVRHDRVKVDGPEDTIRIEGKDKKESVLEQASGRRKEIKSQ